MDYQAISPLHAKKVRHLGFGLIGLGVLLIEGASVWTHERLNARDDQATFLIDVINRKGGITEEFDKIAVRNLGLTLNPPKTE